MLHKRTFILRKVWDTPQVVSDEIFLLKITAHICRFKILEVGGGSTSDPPTFLRVREVLLVLYNMLLLDLKCSWLHKKFMWLLVKARYFQTRLIASLFFDLILKRVKCQRILLLWTAKGQNFSLKTGSIYLSLDLI